MIQLPELYSKHLKKQFNYPQYLILVILINLLQDLQTVRLEELARRFPIPIQLRSRIKKLQRYLSLPQFKIKTLWFPILAEWIKTEWKPKEVIYLVIRGKSSKEPWYILTNLKNLSAATDAYSKRMGIEEMFRDLKGGGYNLEVTQVTNHRLIAIILLITLAYSISTLSGQYIKQKGIAKYVTRPTEQGRVYPRHSSFSIGLHGQNWIESNTSFQEIVQELIRFSSDKNDYYRQGMRAKTLILQAF